MFLNSIKFIHRIQSNFKVRKKALHYDSSHKTNFGFTEVNESEKFEKVNKVFSNVAYKYDTMNDCMSLGIHRIWKDTFVRELFPIRTGKYLDVAGGTGDIAFKILRESMNSNAKLNLKSSLEDFNVTICDINPDMLAVGKEKASKNLSSIENKRLEWVVGDAENLDFEDETFDAYTISFGIRNCVHIEKVLEEAYRVLKPGGRFLCLEFGKIEVPFIKKLYGLYSFQVIPVLGHLIAQDWNSYQYLVESIEKFPSQDTFKSMIQDANFSNVTVKNLSLGIAFMSSGFKI